MNNEEIITEFSDIQKAYNNGRKSALAEKQEQVRKLNEKLSEQIEIISNLESENKTEQYDLGERNGLRIAKKLLDEIFPSCAEQPNFKVVK